MPTLPLRLKMVRMISLIAMKSRLMPQVEWETVRVKVNGSRLQVPLRLKL
jgi:hypothetical protein